MTLASPSLSSLVPQQHLAPNGNMVYYFKNDNLPLVKIDFTLEAGSCYQWAKSQAHGANKLFGEATQRHTAAEIAEFMDFRGIVVDRESDVMVSNLSVYFLRRYAEELLPLLREMFDMPVVTQQLFDSYQAHRLQQVQLCFQKTNYLARNKFYELLYGFDHPLGTYATSDDVEQLTLKDVEDFIQQRYRLGAAHIVLSGAVDDELLQLVDRHLSHEPVSVEHASLAQPMALPSVLRAHCPMDNAVQTSLRIGRVLPFAWNSMDYVRFMVLNTVLGGYFGSRLMSNIREDKGYTYGIYSQTQLFRGMAVFYITADVAGESAGDAVNEVLKEVGRLKEEQVEEEELERVRNFMMGDFIRSIDGVFELSERYRQLTSAHISEQFSANLMEAIQTTTPAQLREIARKTFSDLVVVTAGV